MRFLVDDENDLEENEDIGDEETPARVQRNSKSDEAKENGSHG